MNIDGHLDRCDRNGVGGWVIDTDAPLKRLDLAVYVNGIIIGQCQAKNFRIDLSDSKISDGCCAFYFKFDPYLDVAALENIELHIKDTGYKFTIHYRKPTLFTPPPKHGIQSVRRFKQCILHIGTEKTGSTSIQTMLVTNRAKLEEYGYFMPLSLRQATSSKDGNHSHIAAMALRNTAFDFDLRGHWGITDTKTLEAYRQKQTEIFTREIENTPIHCDKIILSNEHCHSRLLTIEEIEWVKEWLSMFCDEVKVVVYLRPQFEVALSQYGMLLIGGYFDIEALPQLPYPTNYSYRRYTNALYFDYEKLLQRWETVFGTEALLPRLYNVGRQGQHRVPTLDFLDVLNIRESAVVQPPRENTNISAAAQEFLIKLYTEFAERGLSPTAPWVDPIRALIRAKHPGQGVLPSQEKIREFQEAYSSSNERVCAHWFPERRQLFSDDYSSYPEHESNSLDYKIIFSIFTDLLLAKK